MTSDQYMAAMAAAQANRPVQPETPPPVHNRGPASAPAPDTRKPSEKLGIYEWMELMRTLGWPDGVADEEEFWTRLEAWDVEQLLRKEVS